LGGTIKGFCRVIDQARSKIYNWFRREKQDALEDQKPIAHRHPQEIPPAKITEVIEFIARHPEISTNYVVAVRTGISRSSVGNIKKKHGKTPVEREVNTISGSYSWLKRNVCWSIDTMTLKFIGGWLYALVLIEESSRSIIGYKVVPRKLGIYACELVLAAITEMGIKPLVVKHDRGSEFENKEFQGVLKQERIVSLPSPGYYAPFNSRIERTIRIIRRFTAPLEIRYDATLSEIDRALYRAQRDITRQMPRQIFKGKTSQEVYEAAEDYQEYERERLIEDVYETQEIEDKDYFIDGKRLDRLRCDVVDSLCKNNLCHIEYRLKKVTIKLTG
jgi:transposase InsO family protein